MLFDIALESLPKIISWQKNKAVNKPENDEFIRYIEVEELISRQLEKTTFYELARSACNLIYEANLNPLAIASALPDLRFPSEKAWIEFDAETRYEACTRAGQDTAERICRQPSRMAFFIECDNEDCRKGAIYRFTNFKHSDDNENSAWKRMGLSSSNQLVGLDRVLYRFDLDTKPKYITQEEITKTFSFSSWAPSPSTDK